MKLVVDSVGNKHSGGARVLLEILNAALANAQITHVSLLASPARFRRFVLPTNPKLRVIDIEFAESIGGRLWWALRGLDERVWQLRPDVFLGLNGYGPVGGGCASILFVQQSLPYSPEGLRCCSQTERLRMWMIRSLVGRAARGAKHIFVQSLPMRCMVIDAFKLNEAKVSYFLPGVERLSPMSGASLKLETLRTFGKKSLIYVGNQSAYKNTKIIGAAISLPAMAGIKWFATFPSSHPDCESGLATPLGTLDSAELHEALTLAGALVLPSFTETVGLPMLEAMRAGTPVLAADRPYAHAVCENAAIFFDPMSAADLASKARYLLDDASLSAEMVRRGHALIAKREAADVYGRMVSKIVELVRQ